MVNNYEIRNTQYAIHNTNYYVRNYKKNMQNKPNFRKSQMNVNSYNTTNYEKFIPLAGQKIKPNSNPIKPNLQKAQMNVTSLITKDYRKKDDFAVRINKPNSNPISKQLVGAGPRRAESAKMAQKIDVLKHQNIILKNSNFLYPNRLNSLNQHNPLTGTSFAQLSL